MSRRSYDWWGWCSTYSGDDDVSVCCDDDDDELRRGRCLYCGKWSTMPTSGAPNCCEYGERKIYLCRRNSPFHRYFVWRDSDDGDMSEEECATDTSADERDEHENASDRRYVHEATMESVDAHDLGGNNGDKDDDDGGDIGPGSMHDGKQRDKAEGSSSGSADDDATGSDSDDVDNSVGTDDDNDNNRAGGGSSCEMRAHRRLSLLYRRSSRRRYRLTVVGDSYDSVVDEDVGADCTASDDDGYDLRDVDDSAGEDDHDHYSNIPANHVGRGGGAWDSSDAGEHEVYQSVRQDVCQDECADAESRRQCMWRNGLRHWYMSSDGGMNERLADRDSVVYVKEDMMTQRMRARLRKKARARSRVSQSEKVPLLAREKLGGMHDGGVREYREGPHLQCMRCGAQHDVEGGMGGEVWCCGGEVHADGGLDVVVATEHAEEEEVESGASVKSEVDLWWGNGICWSCAGTDDAGSRKCVCKNHDEANAGAAEDKVVESNEDNKREERAGKPNDHQSMTRFEREHRDGGSKDRYCCDVDGEEEKDIERPRWDQWIGRDRVHNNIYRENDCSSRRENTRGWEYEYWENRDSPQRDERNRENTHVTFRKSWRQEHSDYSRQESQRWEYTDYPRQESRDRELEPREDRRLEYRSREYGSSSRHANRYREHRSQRYGKSHIKECRSRKYDYSHRQEHKNRENDDFLRQEARDRHSRYYDDSPQRDSGHRGYGNAVHREYGRSRTQSCTPSQRLEYRPSQREYGRQEYQNWGTDRGENDNREYSRREHAQSERHEYRGRSRERVESSRENYRYRNCSPREYASRATSESSRRIARSSNTQSAIPRDDSPHTKSHRSARAQSISPRRDWRHGGSRRSVSPRVRRNNWIRGYSHTRSSSPRRGSDAYGDGSRGRGGDREGSGGGEHRRDTTPGPARRADKDGCSRGQEWEKDYRRWGSDTGARWADEGRLHDGDAGRGGVAARTQATVQYVGEMRRRGHVLVEVHESGREREWKREQGGGRERGLKRYRQESEEEEKKDVALGLSYGEGDERVEGSTVVKVEVDTSSTYRDIRAHELDRFQRAGDTEVEEKTGRHDDRVEYSGGYRRRKRVDEKCLGREKQMRDARETDHEVGGRQVQREGGRDRGCNADDVVQLCG